MIIAPVTGLLILLLGQAMAVMDGSIMAVCAPSLSRDLHASGGELQLVVSMYALAFAALVVIGARLGAGLGYRRAFLAGVAAFTSASLIGGLAPNPMVLIGARALQGTAAAVMTPQVLSIIQLHYHGEQRARAIGGYSMILAVGVAAGQILGGLIVGAHLLSAAWRPALLINAPIGAGLLLGARRSLPQLAPGDGQPLDLRGAALLSFTLLTLVIPLSFGRQEHWPGWVWPSFAMFGVLAGAFVATESRLIGSRRQPLLDLRVVARPGVAPGLLGVVLLMASYSGFLLSLTLYLQGELRFSPLHAGATFAVYASGFAVASLTWTRLAPAWISRLPTVGPLLMGTALMAFGVVVEQDHWHLAPTAALLLAAGVGHAWAFSPLAHRLTSGVQPGTAADLSGLILTASLVGNVLGIAAFAGIYLSANGHHPAKALALTTGAIAASLGLAAICARTASVVGVRQPRSLGHPTARQSPDHKEPSWEQ